MDVTIPGRKQIRNSREKRAKIEKTRQKSGRFFHFPPPPPPTARAGYATAQSWYSKSQDNAHATIEDAVETLVCIVETYCVIMSIFQVGSSCGLECK